MGLQSERVDLIRSWIPNALPTNQWKLLYRKSRDNSKFHALCDGKGRTVVIAKSTSGYIFGAFAAASWVSSPANYSSAGGGQSFLFTISNPYGLAPTKFPCSNGTYEMYCHPSFGPAFGGGQDFLFSADGSSCNIGFPHSYSDTSGYGRSVFAGAAPIPLLEWEVWTV